MPGRSGSAGARLSRPRLSRTLCCFTGLLALQSSTVHPPQRAVVPIRHCSVAHATRAWPRDTYVRDVSEQPRAQLVAWGVAAVLLVVAGVKLLGAREASAPAAPVRVERGAAEPGSRDAGTVYVHVAGAVRRPGLYRVPVGSRVAGALRRAGGPLSKADLTAVNLAARLEDGQQVVLPRAGAVAGAGAGATAGGTASGGASGAPISLGAATVEQLDGVDGIGPTLAQRIVEYRQAHGGFSSVNDLREVEGIGEKRLAAIKEAVNP
jgi:competence protein ComEA